MLENRLGTDVGQTCKNGSAWPGKLGHCDLDAVVLEYCDMPLGLTLV